MMNQMIISGELRSVFLVKDENKPVYDANLNRRQIINEYLTKDFKISAHGQYVLALFDKIVGKK